jgi:hypothetical protein
LKKNLFGENNKIGHYCTLAVLKFNLLNFVTFLITCKNYKYLFGYGLGKVSPDRTRVRDAKLVR